MATLPRKVVSFSEIYGVAPVGRLTNATSTRQPNNRTRIFIANANTLGITTSTATNLQWYYYDAAGLSYPVELITSTYIQVGVSTQGAGSPAALVASGKPVTFARPTYVTSALKTFYLLASTPLTPNDPIVFTNSAYRDGSVGNVGEGFRVSKTVVSTGQAVTMNIAVPPGSPSVYTTSVNIGGIQGTATDRITFSSNKIAATNNVRDFFYIQPDSPLATPYAYGLDSQGFPAYPYPNPNFINGTQKATLTVNGVPVNSATSHYGQGYAHVYDTPLPAGSTPTNYTRLFTRYYYNESPQTVSPLYVQANVIAAYRMQETCVNGTVSWTKVGGVLSYVTNQNLYPAGDPYVYSASAYFITHDGVYIQNEMDQGWNSTATVSLTYPPRGVLPSPKVAINKSYITNDTLTIGNSVGATPIYPTHTYTRYTADAVNFFDNVNSSARYQSVTVIDNLIIGNAATGSGIYRNVYTEDALTFADLNYLPMLQFTTPTTKVVPPILPDTRGPAYMLFRHYAPTERHVNVFQLSDGTYVQDYPTVENSNSNVPYPWIPDSPDNQYAFVTYFNGTTERFTLNPYIKRVFWGGETSVITQQVANEMVHKCPLYANYMEPINA